MGWHQDWQYWRYWEDDSELFTAWIAISDVREDSGPVSFLVGSHRWGFLDTGDFLASDLAHQLQAIQVSGGKKWREVPTILSLGSISFHHRLTYHTVGQMCHHCLDAVLRSIYEQKNQAPYLVR